MALSKLQAMYHMRGLILQLEEIVFPMDSASVVVWYKEE